MTTKNFLLFQAGKQGGSGGVNAKAIFKTESANPGEETVYDPNGEGDVTVTLPSSQYEDITSDSPEAGPVDATFKLIESDEGYTLRVSYDGGVVYFKVVADPATEGYVRDEISKLSIPNISVVGKNPGKQNGVVWNGFEAGRLLPENLFTVENDGKCFVIRNYGGTFYLVAEDKPSVPTKVSELENDEDFITSDDVPSPVFKAVYNTTTLAEVRAAIDAGQSVVCDVSGYEYCLAKDDSTSVTFSSTYKDNSGNVTQDSATVTNEGWSAESVTLAKSTDVPTNTSQLVNDSNFAKVVVSADPPAEGTPDDVLTAVLGGEPTPFVPDAPDDGAFYVRSNKEWVKIADATHTIVEGYPVESADEYELVGKFNGNFYGKVEVEVTGSLTIGLWNMAALGYDKEVAVAEGTAQVLELGTRNAEYELHAKGAGSIVSAVAKN